MEAVIWIEELDHAGRVRLRHRVAGTRARVGRGYSADVMIDDAYVSPLHLEIELLDNGGLMLRDLGSDNGCQLDGKVFDQVITASDCTVRLGETLLRLRSAAHAVPAAVRGRRRDWLGILRGPWVPLLLMLAALGLSAGEDWLRRFDPAKLGADLNSLGMLFLGLLVWALVWAGFSRLLLHRNEFGRHLALGSLGLLGWFLAGEALDLLEYAWISGVPSLMLTLLLLGGLGFGLLFSHLRLTTRFGSHTLAVGSAVIVGLSLGFFVLLQYIDGGQFDAEPAYDSRIAPLPAAWVPSSTIDEFFADTGAVRDEAEHSAVPKE